MSLSAAPATLDIATVARLLGAEARRFDIDLLPECGSTNAELLARAERGAASGTVIVAEHQTDGRGRRGRRWISAPGDSLTFSLLWRFAPSTVPMGLSLAVGVAVINGLSKVGADEATAQQGGRARNALLAVADGGTGRPSGRRWPAEATGLQLKWPNDILLEHRKLGGILVELVPGVPHAAVIGIGINRRLPEALPQDLRTQVTAIGNTIESNALLASLLSGLLAALERFARHGFSSLREDWLALHAFQNAPVTLSSDFAPPRTGVCRGVDDDGALLFEANGTVERVLSGEVSLRPCP
jgi:BirA family biotin operon repressor/biotin-[acetyl-CoA-carboxylase] ligase